MSPQGQYARALVAQRSHLHKEAFVGFGASYQRDSGSTNTDNLGERAIQRAGR